MLNKEACERALQDLRKLEREDNFEKYNQVAPQVNCDVFGQLIEEYFKLVSKYKKLQKVNEKQTNIIRENAFFHVSHNWLEPYKFEDLKVGMWVWDDKLNACFLIKELKPQSYWNVIIYANYLTDTFEEMHFEKNRFYPVTKVLCNGIKKNEREENNNEKDI